MGSAAPILDRVALPDFGTPATMPEIPPEVYEARLALLRERAGDRGYDRVLVYADREHSANAAYLTGFDPRFEEGLPRRSSAARPSSSARGWRCRST